MLRVTYNMCICITIYIYIYCVYHTNMYMLSTFNKMF